MFIPSEGIQWGYAMRIIISILFILLSCENTFAYNIQAVRKLYNDFPNDHYMTALDRGSPDFDFYAYFKYATTNQCTEANLWLENMRKKDIEYYALIKGIAYGNGDCTRIDFYKSESLLLSCFDNDHSCRRELSSLYSKFGVTNKWSESLLLYIAEYGSIVAIENIYAIHISRRTKYDYAIAYFWLGVLSNSPNIKSNVHLHDAVEKDMREIKAVIGDANSYKVSSLSSKMSATIINNLKRIKPDTRLYVTLYHLTTSKSLKIQGVLDKSQVAPSAKSQNIVKRAIDEQILAQYRIVKALVGE